MLAAEKADVGEPSSEETLEAPPGLPAPRFEHYELLTAEDGQPIELGRGAMSITYKAFDIDLQCPVALKVISEKYLGDESARLRFLREARAAASVRHPNVASVYHLVRIMTRGAMRIKYLGKQASSASHFLVRKHANKVKSNNTARKPPKSGAKCRLKWPPPGG
jgi:hypothetical protein